MALIGSTIFSVEFTLAYKFNTSLLVFVCLFVLQFPQLVIDNAKFALKCELINDLIKVEHLSLCALRKDNST